MQSFAFALTLAGLAVAPATAAAAADAAPPNILFLLADDQSFETVRAFGHTDIDTPHLDRLVARGTTFTHAYNMGSWTPAVCIASRTMLITGRSLWRAQAIHQVIDREREAGRLWPQLMAGAGYFTGFTGKWHVNTDTTRVFQETRHLRGGMPGDTPTATADRQPTSPILGARSTRSSAAIGRVEGTGARSRPTTPSPSSKPRVRRPSPSSCMSPSTLRTIPASRRRPTWSVTPRPDRRAHELPPRLPYQSDIGCGPDLRDEQLAPFPRTPHAVQVHRQEYYALITHLDAQIGRILDALERSGQAGRTWVFFTADQGLSVGHHGLLGKQNLYEHSLRVPFVVAGPDVKAGATITTPIYLQDIMATALDLAHVPRADTLEFHSLLPLLRGKTSPPPATPSTPPISISSAP
ncbi:MAG: sulfatase-like hydrolase/transferase [Verrucomicrobia bacterium]|nr:sulfatase-like hydrolase/transferase [Verrucomicrobiota bacterium]